MRSRKLNRGFFIAISVVCLLTSSISAGAETIPDWMKPTSRKMFATFGFGPASALSDFATQFKMELTYGYHLQGGATGPALGGVLAPSFGDGVTGFALGGRAWWDFQFWKDLGVYIAPFAQLGFASFSSDITTCVGASCRTESVGTTTLNMMLGVEGRLVISDRGMVFFRPIGLDFHFHDGGMDTRWDILIGGGVYFP